MPLSCIEWKYSEEEKLVDLIVKNPCMYINLHPAKKDILHRERIWADIATQLKKSVEDCKKRWRTIRDTYTRFKRTGKWSKCKAEIHRKLQNLEGFCMDYMEELDDPIATNKDDETGVIGGAANGEQVVITDNQEYYEITVVGEHQTEPKSMIKLVPKTEPVEIPNKKIGRKNCGRKRSIPMPRNLPPIKILPKPITMNGAKIVQYVEEPKPQEQRGQMIDKLIEKVLKENTNEIDVFFRSMAQSVKKLPPQMIPKVKMEVCNVIAKYEMQNFEKM